MTVFIKEEEKAYVVNAREKAPAQSATDMYKNDSSKASRGKKSNKYNILEYNRKTVQSI